MLIFNKCLFCHDKDDHREYNLNAPLFLLGVQSNISIIRRHSDSLRYCRKLSCLHLRIADYKHDDKECFFFQLVRQPTIITFISDNWQR